MGGARQGAATQPKAPEVTTPPTPQVTQPPAPESAEEKAAREAAEAEAAAKAQAAADAKAKRDAAKAKAPEKEYVLLVRIGGTRNGVAWPEVGKRVRLPEAEAADYLRFGYVAEVEQTD